MLRILSIRRACSCVAGICILAAAFTLPAQEKPEAPAEDYVKAHYTKYEYRIPMRDGVRLFTSVYVPKDQSQPMAVHGRPDAVFGGAIWRRPVQEEARAIG